MKAKVLLGGAVSYALPFITLAHTGDHPEAVGNDLLSLAMMLLIGAVVGVAIGWFLYGRQKKLRGPIMAGLVAAVLVSGSLALFAQQPERKTVADNHPELAGKRMEVYKSPGCSCCGGFIAELEAQSADVVVNNVSDEELASIKATHGIGPELESCHTTIIDGYVVEGHVPLEVIATLTTEKPEISGIALPGMPSGTPGMPGPKMESYRIKTLAGEIYLTM
ncbi:MAG TPA: DUF411 domain-containing protein [Candidatus Paceibacterota bacterium]|nr:DUF411 domain-containing protein [Candidatus Paceibacterota bacterium]